jgi:hypothetical protein
MEDITLRRYLTPVLDGTYLWVELYVIEEIKTPPFLATEFQPAASQATSFF